MPKMMIFSLLQRRGGAEAESRCKDAVSTCPLMGEGEGDGQGGDTAQLRIQIVLETRSVH